MLLESSVRSVLRASTALVMNTAPATIIVRVMTTVRETATGEGILTEEATEAAVRLRAGRSLALLSVNNYVSWWVS